MKRTFFLLTLLATVATTVYVSHNLHAEPQDNGQPAQAPQLKMAVINIFQVMKNYQKFQMFEGEYKARRDTYNKQLEGKKLEKNQLMEQAKGLKPGEEAMAEEIKRKNTALDREVQDYTESAKKELMKLEDDTYVKIYREIEQAVGAYARANGLELVLQYVDGNSEMEVYHPLNVVQKLRTQACIPIYKAPGLDITDIVAKMLNNRLQAHNSTNLRTNQ